MPIDTLQRTAHEQLAEHIEHHITQRTWGRVRRLTIDCTPAGVTVRGQTTSYYVKQMAIQACLEVLREANPGCLEINIEVTTALPAERR